MGRGGAAFASTYLGGGGQIQKLPSTHYSPFLNLHKFSNPNVDFERIIEVEMGVSGRSAARWG